MSEVVIPSIDPNEELPFQNIDETDFRGMSRAEQIRHFEVEGYLVMPEILDGETIGRLKQELADAEMTHKSYSVYQTTGVGQPQWHSRAACELIGLPAMIDFLKDLLGPDIVFTRGFFQRTLPGSPPISMHTDGQPHGSDLFGYEGSCPKLIRILYYLDDLTATRAPFRLIPRSHLSFHADASPYIRYKYHPKEITITVPAGSAVLIPAMLFHGTHPNVDPVPRELIQYGYRPAWGGPIKPVEEWGEELVANAPEIAKPFLQSLNTTGLEWVQPHKPASMRTKSDAIDPDRWG
ncbi:MAG: phytanoyl-CoA dioxygenase family protein [Pirellulaceae bacterium]